ncbi:metal-dependent hydrolase [Halobacteriales archaeon QS_1_68_20]|nr:MAG: metal-dependent hydrolase [Halobacteriales archaeon QS_1_68_20]
MYWKGHVGASLLAYAPFGAELVRAGDVAIASLGAAVMVALATLPDLDHRLRLVNHRGFTHTAGFAVLVGAVVGAGGYHLADAVAPLLGPATTAGQVGFLVGTLSVLTHVVADVVTPMGVRPLWPLADWHVSLSLVPAKSPIANYALLFAGVLASGSAMVVAVS